MLNQIELQTGIVLLWPKASILCFDTLKPGLEPVLLRPGQEAAQAAQAAQAELQDPPPGQQEPGQDDAGGTESCLKLPPSWTMRNEQDEAEHDLTELLQACLMALRLPVHAEAHQPRSLRFWSVVDATMRIGGPPRTTPDSGLFEVLVPETTEQARKGSHMSCGI